MSYDLMVFDPATAPRDQAAFSAWYDALTEWTESHGYNNPDVPVPALRNWFREMIEHFPPMNGPLASDDVDDPHVTDYALGRSAIYAAFAWSVSHMAYEKTIELAAKHRVGFYDVSSSDGEVWLPTPDDQFQRDRRQHSAVKPWWRFW